MPLSFLPKKVFGNLYVDFEYVVNNRDMLVEFVALLLIGRSRHVANIIRTLDPNFPAKIKPENISAQIEVLKSKEEDKIDGYLFQMISWIALNLQHKDDVFYQRPPHMQPAEHGFDGLAVTLKPDKSVDKIIITEDKCTTNQRKRIREEVWPEFIKFDNHIMDHGFTNDLTVMLDAACDSDQLDRIEDDVYNLAYRQYRIGINRDDCYVTDKQRMSLFKGYDNIVKDTEERITAAVGVDCRTASTIYIKDLRPWMEQFKLDVIKALEAKLNN